jgi:hypothetical protein
LSLHSHAALVQMIVNQWQLLIVDNPMNSKR